MSKPVISLTISLSLLLGTSLVFAQEGENALTNEPVPIEPPAQGETVIETDDSLDSLFEQLARDPKTESAQATANRIWQRWTTSKSRSVDLLMGWAGQAISREEYARAVDILDHVVIIAPDYAEGWNRRATVYFLVNEYDRSISDIESTLALEPRHFGALSGLAVISQRVGRDEAALNIWYKVLEIYPANTRAQQAVIDLEEKLAGRKT